MSIERVRHFQEELEQLKTRLLEMGGLAEEQVRLAVLGLVQRDRALVARVLTSDEPINALIDIPSMATIAQSMLRDALDAFFRRETSLAHQVLNADAQLNALKTQ